MFHLISVSISSANNNTYISNTVKPNVLIESERARCVGMWELE